MNQFLTLDKNIAKSPSKQDFGYFDFSLMPKTLKEREDEFEAERKKLDEEKKAFEQMKAKAEIDVVIISPTIKRRCKAKERAE